MVPEKELQFTYATELHLHPVPWFTCKMEIFSYVAMEQVLELSGMEKDLEKHLPHGAWCSVSHS